MTSADNREVHEDDQEAWVREGLLLRHHAAYPLHREKRFVHLPLALAIARQAEGIPRQIRPAPSLVLNSLMIIGRRSLDLLAVTKKGDVVLVEAKYAMKRSVNLGSALHQLAGYAEALETVAKGDDWLRLLFDRSYNNKKHRSWAAAAGAPFEWSLEEAARRMLCVGPDELGKWQRALGKAIRNGKALAIVAMNSEAAPRRSAERPTCPLALARWQVGVLEVGPENRIRPARARWLWQRLDRRRRA